MFRGRGEAEIAVRNRSAGVQVAGGEPVKYEFDKASGALFVDRILTTPMRYPCNYGYVPHTLCGDGDPLDALVMMPFPLIPGCVINCRPIGMLEMKDEAGTDEKLVVVPTHKVSPLYRDVSAGLAPAGIEYWLPLFFERPWDRTCLLAALVLVVPYWLLLRFVDTYSPTYTLVGSLYALPIILIAVRLLKEQSAPPEVLSIRVPDPVLEMRVRS